MNKYTFSEREIRAMEVMRDQGKSYLDIAISFGVSQTTIIKALDLAKQKEKAKKHKSSYGELRNAQKKKIEEGWMAYKKFTEIAEDADCSIRAVWQYLETDKLRFVEIPKFNIGKIRERTIEKLAEKKALGKVLKEIAPVPCPLSSCSDRVNCTDIEHPQNCPVWRTKFDPEVVKRINREKRRK